MWLAGVDGCRGGWLCVLRERASGETRLVLEPHAAAILDLQPAPAVVALDMPMGLPERGPRACDRAARALLGPRRSSVFPVLPRAALRAQSREAASRVTRRLDGTRVGCQTWALVPRMREVDALLSESVRARRRLVEVHPELSFRAWNGGVPMPHAKRTPGGLAQRRALLASWLGRAWLVRARRALPRTAAGEDDLLDATAALWTAHRIADGTAIRLPDPAPRDAAGLRMAITY